MRAHILHAAARDGLWIYAAPMPAITSSRASGAMLCVLIRSVMRGEGSACGDGRVCLRRRPERRLLAAGGFLLGHYDLPTARFTTSPSPCCAPVRNGRSPH